MSDGIWQRVSANQGDIFFTQVASGGKVGIGTPTPQDAMHVHTGDVRVSDERDWAGVVTDVASADPVHNGIFVGWRTRGTLSANAYPLAGDRLVSLIGRDGIDAMSPTAFGGGDIHMTATENFALGANGTRLIFQTTPNGSATIVPRVVIEQNGHVGIGTMTADEQLVVSNGATTGRYTSAGWTHSSDLRLKKDIHPIQNPLEKVQQLQGVEFVFNEDRDSKRQIGLIAQEVEKVFPELVATSPDGFKSVSYGGLVAPLLEAVKRLNQNQAALEARVQVLERSHDELIRELKSLRDAKKSHPRNLRTGASSAPE